MAGARLGFQLRRQLKRIKNAYPQEWDVGARRFYEQDSKKNAMQRVQVAAALEAEGFTPKRGGRWHPVTVSRALGRAEVSR